MKRVKIADLKNNLSRHLVYVRDGGAVVVLDRETPIARILPFVPADAHGRPAGSGRDDYWTDERLAELERQGVLTRGDLRDSGGWVKQVRPVKLPAHAPRLTDVLLRTRRESTR